MRVISLRTLGMAGLVVGLSLLGAPARAADVVAPIPFSFQVDGHTLPPGSYHVSLRAPNGVPFVRALDNVLTMANPGDTDDDVTGPRLVFLRLDERYYLREAWLGRQPRRDPRRARDRRRPGTPRQRERRRL